MEQVIPLSNELRKIVISGRLPLVQAAVTDDNLVSKIDKMGYSALHWACSCGRISVIQLLVSSDANINLKNIKGEVPLALACEYGDPECTKFLIDNGATIQIQDNENESPLHVAVRTNQISIVHILLKAGADITCKGRNGSTPFHCVCGGSDGLIGVIPEVRRGFRSAFSSCNGTGILLSLLECVGNDVCPRKNDKRMLNIDCISIRDNDGWAALHYASAKGWKSIVQLLLQKGVPVDVQVETAKKNSLGGLHPNAQLDTFINGENPSIMESEGLTPLHIASREGRVNVAKLLLFYGADVTAKSRLGWTSLHFACDAGGTHSSMIAMLLGEGGFVHPPADCQCLASDGVTTPAMLARGKYGANNIIKKHMQRIRAREAQYKQEKKLLKEEILVELACTRSEISTLKKQYFAEMKDREYDATIATDKLNKMNDGWQTRLRDLKDIHRLDLQREVENATKKVKSENAQLRLNLDHMITIQELTQKYECSERDKARIQCLLDISKNKNAMQLEDLKQTRDLLDQAYKKHKNLISSHRSEQEKLTERHEGLLLSHRSEQDKLIAHHDSLVSSIQSKHKIAEERFSSKYKDIEKKLSDSLNQLDSEQNRFREQRVKLDAEHRISIAKAHELKIHHEMSLEKKFQEQINQMEQSAKEIDMQNSKARKKFEDELKEIDMQNSKERKQFEDELKKVKKQFEDELKGVKKTLELVNKSHNQVTLELDESKEANKKLILALSSQKEKSQKLLEETKNECELSIIEERKIFKNKMDEAKRLFELKLQHEKEISNNELQIVNDKYSLQKRHIEKLEDRLQNLRHVASDSNHFIETIGATLELVLPQLESKKV